MKAYERNFGFISSVGTIKIPFFQRAYIWDESHWTKLWNDLIDSYNGKYSHFLGSIILKSCSPSVSLLIDGQQRTTTFSLLLHAIGKKLDLLDKFDTLKTCLFGQDNKYNKMPKIEHSRLDSPIFKNIILGENITNKDSSIYKCYSFFKEKVASFNDKKLEEFLKKILTDNLFVIVEIDQNEDEQRIFDSINTSGQPLAGFDIVKNDLFSRFDNQTDAENIYNKHWICVFENNTEVKSFWDEYILTGRDNRIRSDIFLQNFAIIKNIFNPSKEILSKINETYKTYINDMSNNKAVEDFIKEFTKYAEIFYNLPFFYENQEYEYDDKMKRFLHILHVLQLSSFFPIALFLELSKNDKKLSEDDYNKSLILLEKYIIRRSILRLDTSSYNKTIHSIIKMLVKNPKSIYSTLEKTINSYTTDTDKFPSKKDIGEVSFEYFDIRLAKILLFWIELYTRNQNKKFINEVSLQYNFQLEHIMPFAWKQYWVLPIIKKSFDDWNEELLASNKISNSIYEMEDSEFETAIDKISGNAKEIISDVNRRNMKINELGNFTLLNGKLNNSIKNSEWSKKLNGDGNKKGISYYDSLLLNKELCKNKKWNEDKIAARTKELKGFILEIWG